MLAFGQPGERQFGGVGAMIDKPGMTLRITRSDHMDIQGPLAARATKIWERFAATEAGRMAPNLEIRILGASAEHVGLGTGTQLTLALMAGLNALVEGEKQTPYSLAKQTGRGERSAIGTYGFFHGGLIVEGGKYPGDLLSPLVSHVKLPEAWRFVIVRPAKEHGLSGDPEKETFAKLPPVAAEVTKDLCRDVLTRLLPAAVDGRFEEFSDALYRYGYEAGLCFAANQGGPFASEKLMGLVEQIRKLGVKGVGQSSWGPTIFALLPNEAAAESFCEQLRAATPQYDLKLVTSAPNNHGATIEISAD